MGWEPPANPRTPTLGGPRGRPEEGEGVGEGEQGAVFGGGGGGTGGCGAGGADHVELREQQPRVITGVGCAGGVAGGAGGEGRTGESEREEAASVATGCEGVCAVIPSCLCLPAKALPSTLQSIYMEQRRSGSAADAAAAGASLRSIRSDALCTLC